MDSIGMLHEEDLEQVKQKIINYSEDSEVGEQLFNVLVAQATTLSPQDQLLIDNSHNIFLDIGEALATYKTPLQNFHLIFALTKDSSVVYPQISQMENSEIIATTNKYPVVNMKSCEAYFKLKLLRELCEWDESSSENIVPYYITGGVALFAQ